MPWPRPATSAGLAHRHDSLGQDLPRGTAVGDAKVPVHSLGGSPERVVQRTQQPHEVQGLAKRRLRPRDLLYSSASSPIAVVRPALSSVDDPNTNLVTTNSYLTYACQGRSALPSARALRLGDSGAGGARVTIRTIAIRPRTMQPVRSGVPCRHTHDIFWNTY
jgi:hypothetical protein